MAPDVRSSVGGNSFDFNSQAGVLAVLGAIRASTLAVTERNELRDLVFLYSNGGGDPGVRTVLEERLREAGITPGATPVKPAETKLEPKPAVVGAGFSSGRPVPVFTPGTVTTASPVSVPTVPTPIPTPEPVAEVKEPVAVSVPSAPVRPVVVVPRPAAPVLPTPVVHITPVIPAAPAPTPEPITVVAPEPTPAPAIPTPAPVAQVVNPAATARLERIRFIKSEVNSRVGNPVNLVDLDNVLGREYMSALLEAMKLIADAPDADAERAMNRLETVYAQVLTLIDSPKEVPAAPAEQIKPIMPSVPAMEMNTASPATTPVPQAPETTPAPWGEADSTADLAPTPIPVRVMPASLNVATIPEHPVAPLQPVSHMPVQSVAASQVPLRSITELPTADEVNSKNAGGDPLFTNEVDSGLQQLLSEWALFKKSGLFGTGPSGREHPLFLKIAPLQLPLLLAGRFEGSTQEIKQSVTDYMNGWRYEQGIVYEKDETFEHYLRRVIRHIIDLQNKKRGA